MDQTSDPTFHALLDSARAAEAIRSRSGLGALRSQWAEDASVSGLLANLSDLQMAVVLTIASGLEWRGEIELVGTTGVVMKSRSGIRSLLRLTGLVSIRTTEPCQLAGDGTFMTTMSWPTMVAAFTEGAEELALAIGHQVITGRLRARSRSVLELRTPNNCSYYAVVDAVDVVSTGSSTFGAVTPIVPGSIRHD